MDQFHANGANAIEEAEERLPDGTFMSSLTALFTVRAQFSVEKPIWKPELRIRAFALILIVPWFYLSGLFVPEPVKAVLSSTSTLTLVCVTLSLNLAPIVIGALALALRRASGLYIIGVGVLFIAPSASLLSLPIYPLHSPAYFSAGALLVGFACYRTARAVRLLSSDEIDDFCEPFTFDKQGRPITPDLMLNKKGEGLGILVLNRKFSFLGSLLSFSCAIFIILCGPALLPAIITESYVPESDAALVWGICALLLTAAGRYIAMSLLVLKVFSRMQTKMRQRTPTLTD